LMRLQALKARPRRRRLPPDLGERKASAVAPNVLDRSFEAPAPNRKWIADFTYVWTAEGWLYVAAVIDLFSRRVVGWSMSAAMTAQLVTDALVMAIWRRGRPDALLHHSDRGSQYTSDQFQRLMADNGVICLMSRSGNVWDNAAMESFFSSLKTERTARKMYRTRDEARADVFDYIERFYNPKRRHSTIGYLSPMEFEQKAGLDRMSADGPGGSLYDLLPRIARKDRADLHHRRASRGVWYASIYRDRCGESANAIAVAEGERGGEVRYIGEVDASVESMRRAVKQLTANYDDVLFCYEAGPTGYGLHRLIRSLGFYCMVVTPSLIPRRPGDHVKNNRRDAIGLAKLLRAGELTAVWVPDEGHEAMRDLVRARSAVVETLRVHRQQVSALMLRHGRRFPRKTTWTKSYLRWLQEQKFDHPAHQIVLQEAI
jgi:putative transposase